MKKNSLFIFFILASVSALFSQNELEEAKNAIEERVKILAGKDRISLNGKTLQIQISAKQPRIKLVNQRNGEALLFQEQEARSFIETGTRYTLFIYDQKILLNKVHIELYPPDEEEMFHLKIAPEHRHVGISGTIKEQIDSAEFRQVESAFVFLFKNEVLSDEQVTDQEGLYEFELEPGSSYIVLSRRDMVRASETDYEEQAQSTDDTTTVQTPDQEPEITRTHKDIVFKIQIAASEKPIPGFYKKNISLPLQIEKAPSGVKRYLVGNYYLFEKADSMRRNLVRKGFSDAFVAAYDKGNRIPVKQALQKIEETKPAGSAKEKNAVSNQKEANKEQIKDRNPVDFRVQIAAAREALPKDHPFLEMIDDIYHKKFSDGIHRYFSGSFKTLNEATVHCREIQSKGIKNAFVTAYKGEERIRIDQAKKMVEE